MKYALLHAVGATVYISLIATFMANVNKIIGQKPENSIFGPMAFLLIIVISAAVMGLTIFARPIMWYLDGNKKEAISLVIWTIIYLFVIAVIDFIIIAL